MADGKRARMDFGYEEGEGNDQLTMTCTEKYRKIPADHLARRALLIEKVGVNAKGD